MKQIKIYLCDGILAAAILGTVFSLFRTVQGFIWLFNATQKDKDALKFYAFFCLAMAAFLAAVATAAALMNAVMIRNEEIRNLEKRIKAMKELIVRLQDIRRQNLYRDQETGFRDHDIAAETPPAVNKEIKVEDVFTIEV